MLKLYNTLTKKIEEIEKPVSGHFNLYTCGPTVYNYAHIGNLRSYIEADFLYRTLKYKDFNPKWVMNITDIDDKTIRDTIKKFGPSATKEDLRNYTTVYFEEFKKDLFEVNVLVKEIKFIRVSEVIPEIQKFIIELVKKKYAYVTEDGVYFSIEKYQKDFKDYGVLVGEKFLEGKKVGARVNVDEYEKENLSDFVLWKARNPETDGEIFWEDLNLDPEIKIPAGHPGWHIECSTINNLAFNGEKVDIHTGGTDLIFPHHTNEIAQSQAYLGKGKFVSCWSHCEHLLVDSKKMAKSLNNSYILKDLSEKVPVSGLALRYLFAQSSYRSQQNFTMQSFIGSYNALEKIYNILKSYKVIGQNQEIQQNFFYKYKGFLSGEVEKSLSKDLNLPQLLALLHEVLSAPEINIHTQNEIVKEYEKVLGLKLVSTPSILEEIELPVEVKDLLSQRMAAKNEKNFLLADQLREKIEILGFEITDNLDTQKIKKKIKI